MIVPPIPIEGRIMIQHEFPAHSIVLDKLEAAQEALSDKLGDGSKRKYARFIVAALSSPWRNCLCFVTCDKACGKGQMIPGADQQRQ